MSLTTDIAFIRALRRNAGLMQQLAAHDVYCTAIALPDEQADNAPLPYIIVAYDGGQNDEATKDGYEADTDTVDVSLTIAAPTRIKLGELATMARNAVREYFEAVREHAGTVEGIEPGDAPYSYRVSFSEVTFDQLKPCFWQVLKYNCNTDNT